MESNTAQDLLRVVNEERQRLEARLRANPDFQKLLLWLRLMALYEPQVQDLAHSDSILNDPENTR